MHKRILFLAYNMYIVHIVGLEQERIISRASKMEKIEKESLQHAVNSAKRAKGTIKHS